MAYRRIPAHAFIPFLLFSTLTLGSTAAAPANAANVVLTNGDRLTGEIVLLSDGKLSVRSEVFGKVDIPWAQVRSLQSGEDVRIRLRSGSTVTGPLKIDDDGSAVIGKGRPAESGRLMRQDIAALNPPMADHAVKYSGHVNLGGSFNRGNTYDNQLNLLGDLAARTPENRYSLGFEVNEASSAGVKTASNRRLHTQYDAFLDPKNYVFVNAKLESDELADLDLRTALGAGYGRQFFETDIAKLAGQAGLGYVHEDYGTSPNRNFPSLNLGLKYDRKLFDDRLEYFHRIDVDESLQDAGDLLVRNRLGLRVPVGKGVNLSTQLNVDYDRSPAIGKKTTDTALIFSVGYGF
ncbi:MAG: DUF481 domain-containing protein [Burkholderiaceae bacterium]